MGRTSQFRSLAAKAFDIAGDVVSLVTYVQVVPGAYNPATGTRALTETTHTNVRALLVGLTDREQTWFPADANVQKAIITWVDLPVALSTQDYLTIDSINWEIVKIKTPPTAAIRVLFIQEP